MRRAVLATLVALGMAAAVNAHAFSTILFDTNGAAGGGVITVKAFDWLPDTAVGAGAVPLAAFPGSTTFDLYTQAKLGNFLSASDNPILGTGLNAAFEITYQAGFTEVGSHAVLGLNDVAAFNLAPSTPVNFFNMYFDSTPDANALAGTGYGDGTLILSGVVIGNVTSFAIPLHVVPGGLAPTIQALDQSAGDNYPGVLTVVGSGGGTVDVDVATQNFTYFLSNISDLILDAELSTTNKTPFDSVNPSAMVVGQVAASGFSAGQINGIAATSTNPNFLFQTDGNNTFNKTTGIPEPGTMVLLGSGLLGLAGMGRRREKK